MTSEPTIREKGRAVFLAAIMVLSVVAMSAAFAGSAAADTQPYDDDDLQYVNVDNESVSVVFQGQDVYVVGDLIDEDNDYQLRSVDSFDSGQVDSSSFEEELDVEDHTIDGESVSAVEIETGDLDAGDFFIRGGDLESSPAEEDTFEVTIQDLDVAFDDDEVTDDGPDATTDLDIDSDRGTYSLNVSAQGDLDEEELLSILINNETLEEIHLDDDVRDNVTFGADDNPIVDDDIVGAIADADEDGVFGVDSNDDLDDVLDALEAENQFLAFAFAEDEDDADEQVVLVGINDREEEVDFTDIDDGDYTFDFEVTDTEAAVSQDITVTDSDASVNFDQSVYTQTAGDLVEFTVELEDTDSAYVQFGDEDAGFVDIFYVEDDGGTDDEVTFWLNTRTIGTENASNDEVVYSEDDIVESFIHSDYEFDDADDQPRFFDDSDLEENDEFEDGFIGYLDELDLIDSSDDETPFDQLVRPLQPADYDLVVDENGYFIAEDGESDVDDEIGYATLDLIEPGLGEVTTWVGPSEDADEYDEIAELAEQLTERENVAIDDQLVIEAEMSGIYGMMTYLEGSFDPIVDDDGFDSATLYELTELEGEGVTLEVEADDAVGNQDANELDLEGADDDEVYVLVDNDEGMLYVIVDTDDEPFDRSLDDGDDFTVDIEYETDSDDRFNFADIDDDENRDVFGGADGDTGDAAFPYFQADSTQSISTTFTFEDPEVHFDNLDADDNVQLETAEDAVVTGETNVAPGSDADLRITNAGDTDSFLSTEDAEIHSDGAFESEHFDFGDRSEDDEAAIDFRVGGSSIGDADGIFVESVDDEAPEEDDEADDDEADDDAADDDEADDDEADDDAADDDATDDDVVDEDDDDEPETEDDGVPGFGIAVALFALIAAGMLALRRQN
ncbi:BGTF surface domain-containing protein [Natrarchaeobaculum sulfurireducens]|uniref:Phage protein n=1 Tax=Natrarchaeobaculum sulfurireducens TaxID=2044521 RepID=A0A346PSJ3_9EURY|nr:BGTF surface domain-containing protein [Natrarchaeobaculum sulfurireducens]AXR77570.1 S-layer protein [Natrarchaeobaculum sulfurireducens]AXR82488.1 Phage protein [Natrarchaeobaculum sulfurireducens]